MKLHTVVSDRIHIAYPKDAIDHPLFEKLKEQHTHANPKYELLARLRKRRFGVPRVLKFWKVADEDERYVRFSLPRGAEDQFLQLAEYYNVDVKMEDQTVCPPLPFDVPDPWWRLDRFQQRALRKMLDHTYGCLEAPTGSGKTNILLSLVHYLQTPTLILVHTRELLRQTRERCAEWLGVEAGILGDGQVDLRPITVAMVQTLSRLEVDYIAEQYGAVIVDEAHHSPCNTWGAILNSLPARYKYGFTATAWRKDKMEFLIWEFLGPIRWKVTRQEAVTAGRIMWPKVEKVETEFFFPVLDPSQWGEMISCLTTDKQRNELIERTVRKRLNAEARALVLTDRVSHAEHLAQRLRDLHPALLVGTMDTMKRRIAMERVKNGAQLTVATTHLLGEGVDVPGWDMLFLVTPFARGPRVLQALGRIVRTAKGKSAATLVDFIDYKIPMLVRAAIGRQSLYGEKERDK